MEIVGQQGLTRGQFSITQDSESGNGVNAMFKLQLDGGDNTIFVKQR